MTERIHSCMKLPNKICLLLVMVYCLLFQRRSCLRNVMNMKQAFSMRRQRFVPLCTHSTPRTSAAQCAQSESLSPTREKGAVALTEWTEWQSLCWAQVCPGGSSQQTLPACSFKLADLQTLLGIHPWGFDQPDTGLRYCMSQNHDEAPIPVSADVNRKIQDW